MTLADLYNLRRVFTHRPRKLRSFFDLKRDMPSSSFCSGELQRALQEQAFGIKSYALSSNSSHQATATIVLLDGAKISIQLTTQGYSVVSGPANSKIYETIEDLLQVVSPLYGKKRQEVLFAKLANYS